MDGRAFEGPQGLKKILMEDKESFSRAFIENILSYAMARELTFLDRENVEITSTHNLPRLTSAYEISLYQSSLQILHCTIKRGKHALF